MQNYNADVIIVGAGPAGTVLSFLLAEKGLNTILVERDSIPREKVCGDFITSNTLTPLKQLGIGLDPEDQTRIDQIDIYLSNDYKLSLYQKNGDGFGVICKREEFDSYLCSKSILAGAQLYDRFTIMAPFVDEKNRIGGVQGIYKGKEITLSARLTVLATGGGGTLPLKFGLINPKPTMIAKRAYYEGSSSQNVGILYYSNLGLPGYSWIFPLGNGLLNVGFGYYVGNKNLSSVDRFAAAEPGFSKLLNGARKMSELKGYPVRTGFLESSVIGNGVLCIGEAAGLVNPITGAGISLAVESAQIAAKAIHKILCEIQEPDRDALKQYDLALKSRYVMAFQKIKLIENTVFSKMNYLRLLAKILIATPKLQQKILNNYPFQENISPI